MPIDKVTGKRRETTAEERISVIVKKAEGKSSREIVEITGISKSQATKIVEECNENSGFLVVMSNISGCFPKRSIHTREITKDSDLNASEDTVRRPLREKGYYVHITRKKPFLTKRKQSIRYTCCNLR
jgi:hypothetical protein